MAVIIKCMSNGNQADSINAKGFTLTVLPENATVEFYRDEWIEPEVRVETRGEEADVYTLKSKGNIYVVDSGKTVATFAHAMHHDWTSVEVQIALLEKQPWAHELDGEMKSDFAMMLCDLYAHDRSRDSQTWNFRFCHEDKQPLSMEAVEGIKGLIASVGFAAEFYGEQVASGQRINMITATVDGLR